MAGEPGKSRDPAALQARIRELEAAVATGLEAYDRTLAAVAVALDFRERECGPHSHRVALYAVLLGMRTDLDEAALGELYRGALVHDIGKVGIPDEILLKSDALSARDWEKIRQHPEIGASLLTGIAFLREAAEVTLAHHEAWDGSGYPYGLREHQIHRFARIFAVVDSYDCIRSPRPWKSPEPHDQALPQLKRVAGSRLDPALVEIFCQEPETTWSRLDKSAGGDPTFAAALEACRSVDRE